MNESLTSVCPEQPAERPAAKEWRRAALYQVSRCLLAWTVLIAAAMWALRDALYLAGVELSYQRAANWLSRMGDDWLGKVVDRLGTSLFEQMQVVLFLIALGYGLGQIVAAWMDRAVMLNPTRPLLRRPTSARLASLILARPLSFLNGTTTPQERKLHFAQGREIVFSPLKLGLWLFPVLGFLGTIIGISAAIERLPDAMKERGGQLTAVVSQLHFAFDTTFLGLIAAIVLMFTTAATASVWERNHALHGE